MIRLYAGFDRREEVGYHVFCASVIERASAPVAITPLTPQGLAPFFSDGQRDGSNAFTYSRFLIPFMQNFEGWAIFADGSDMLMRGDIAELAALYNPYKAVQVVKQDYRTRHARKYIGTPMETANEDYPRKNWSSLMLINCAHYSWRDMTPDKVADLPGSFLHRLAFIEERFIGELPEEWNHLVGEKDYDPNAKLAHFTLGIPRMQHYQACDYASEWYEQAARMNEAC